MKMLKITRLALLSFLFSCLALFAAETTRVTNLTATPRTPWNGLVDITYSLECDTPDAVMAVSFQGFDYDWNESIPMTTLTGDGAGGELLPAGGPYHIVWDSANDWPEGHSSEFTVTATAEVKETTPLYLVVDLNTGAVTPSAAGPDLSNDTCRTTELWLRRIPKGTFIMGSPASEVGRNSDETQHQVTLTEDFYIGVFEITQKQYSLIYGSNPSFYEGDTRPVESVSYNDIRGTGGTAGAGWPAYGHAVDEDSFLGKLRAKTGQTFDLPTEAQWEYACRAGTTTALNTGKNLTSEEQDSAMDEAGRYDYNQNDGKGGYSYTHTKVGSYLPNAWGLYDMHGNVWEWCLDWWKEDLGSSAVTDPKGPNSGSDRVMRGGGWSISYAQSCRSAHRSSYAPYYHDLNSGGFRVVLLLTADAEEPEPTPEPDFTSDYIVVNLNTGAVTSSSTGPDLSDDTCRTTELWFRRIPKGTFIMGSPEGEVGREVTIRKETLHQVTLTEDFYIGVFEITQKQYSLIYGSNPSSHYGGTRPVESVSYNDIRGTGSTDGAGWPSYGHAVDSGSFLGKLRAKTGKTFDLPTEAQWEYACRAGTTTALNTGKNLTSEEQDSAMDEAGRYGYNENDGKGGYSSNHTEVGSYLPNAWGLYDMHGNVWEWCLDWWNSDLSSSAVTDPKGPNSGSGRVVRGGSWNNGAQYCRSAYRYYNPPSYSGRSTYGFRVVLLLTADAEEPEPTPEPDFTSDYLVVNLNTGAVTPSTMGPDLTDDTCRTTELWLRRIPKGTFIMGSPEYEVGRGSYETQHQVTLTEDFYIGVFEITQKQYSLIYGSNPSSHYGGTRPVESVSYNDIRGTGSTDGAGWPSYGHAVDSGSFLGKLRAKTGKTFDLPTEAQWEYACRAGTTTALNTGKNLTSEEQDSAMDEAGRYGYNENDGKGGYSSNHTEVGSYLPNAWGLYDMHGNVYEWCLDWYTSDLGSSAVTDPKGPASGSSRVIRSGSCLYYARVCRSASRGGNDPSYVSSYSGFRVVLLP